MPSRESRFVQPAYAISIVGDWDEETGTVIPDPRLAEVEADIDKVVADFEGVKPERRAKARDEARVKALNLATYALRNGYHSSDVVAALEKARRALLGKPQEAPIGKRVIVRFPGKLGDVTITAGARGPESKWIASSNRAQETLDTLEGMAADFAEDWSVGAFAVTLAWLAFGRVVKR